MQINKNYLIVGLLATLLIILFFFTCNKPKEQKTKYIPVVATIEGKVKSDSAQYHKSIDSLQAIEAKLYKKVYEQKGDLKAAQELVVELLNQPPEYSDTAKLLAQIEILKTANASKDSLCNTTIVTQDSIIAEKENKYQASIDFQAKQRASINQLITNTYAAEAQIKSLGKQVRKERGTKNLYKITTLVAILYGAAKTL